MSYRVQSSSGLDDAPTFIGGVFASEDDAIRYAEEQYDALVAECLQGANASWWQSIVVEVVEA